MYQLFNLAIEKLSKLSFISYTYDPNKNIKINETVEYLKVINFEVSESRLYICTSVTKKYYEPEEFITYLSKILDDAEELSNHMYYSYDEGKFERFKSNQEAFARIEELNSRTIETIIKIISTHGRK